MTRTLNLTFALAVFSLISPISGAHADDESIRAAECNVILSGNALSQEWVAKQIERMKNQDPTLTRLQTIVHQVGLKPAAINEQILKNHNTDYTFILKGQSVKNQLQTGRCWDFSAGSVLCTPLTTSGIFPSNFEISENYVWFYTLLERSNRYIDNLMKKTATGMDPKTIQMNSIPHIPEGGYFHSFVEIVKKYGVVPKSAMPETAGSSRKGLTDELELMLSDFGLKWVDSVRRISNLRSNTMGFISTSKRQAVMKELEQKKSEVMQGVFQILATHLGIPPTEFKLRLNMPVQPKDPPEPVMEFSATEKMMTPKELVELTGFNKEEWVTVSNFPSREFGRVYQLPDTDEIVPEDGERPEMLKLLNLPMDRMLELIEATLKEGYPVEFDSDVMNNTEFNQGIMHPDLFDTDAVYGGAVDRQELLKSRQKLGYMFKNHATHAMDIIGVDHPNANDKAVKFLVLNSWGPQAGDGGLLHMYREWAEQFVENINIPKRLLSPEEQKMLEQSPIVIKDEASLYRK